MTKLVSIPTLRQEIEKLHKAIDEAENKIKIIQKACPHPQELLNVTTNDFYDNGPRVEQY